MYGACDGGGGGLLGMKFACKDILLRGLRGIERGFLRKEAWMNVEERRKHRRLPIRLDVICQGVGSEEKRLHRGNTLDVSTGGLLMETNSDGFVAGDLVSVGLEVPPTEGLLAFGGQFSSFARVKRVYPDTPAGCIALEFCRRPKLDL